MKVNLLKKVVVGGLITSLCLCCCFLNFNKNVSASAVNRFQDRNNWFEDSTYVPDYFSDINELKGKTFNFNNYLQYNLNHISFSLTINILERDYIGVEINEETHETIQCVDYLQYPYLLFSTFDFINNNYTYSILSFYRESMNTYEFMFYNDVALNSSSRFQLNGSLLSKSNNFSYLPLDDIQEVVDIPFSYTSSTNYDSLQYFCSIFNINFLNEEDFLSNLNNYIPGLTTFYFCFPNTDRYTLNFYTEIPEQQKFFFFELFDYIQPYNANIEDKQLSYTKGYDNGYNYGYNQGVYDASDTSYRLPFLTGIFNAVSDILALEIFPNVRLGYFVLIPLVLGITGMILWFWRKD